MKIGSLYRFQNVVTGKIKVLLDKINENGPFLFLYEEPPDPNVNPSARCSEATWKWYIFLDKNGYIFRECSDFFMFVELNTK